MDRTVPNPGSHQALLHQHGITTTAELAVRLERATMLSGMDARAVEAELERDVMGAALMEALAVLEPFETRWDPSCTDDHAEQVIPLWALERAGLAAAGIRCLLRLPILDHARTRAQLELELAAALEELALRKVAP